MLCRFFSFYLFSFYIHYLKAQTNNLSIICNSVKILNETDRNIDNGCMKCNRSCDSFNNGWYGFGVDATLPTSCPIINGCIGGYWIGNQSHPNILFPGPIKINMYATSLSISCDFIGYISSVAYCSNINMVVYYLLSLICGWRYCYEKRIPCGPNEVSPTGFQPCEIKFPITLTNATTTFATTYNDPLFSNISGTSAKCVVSCPTNISCENVSGVVDWYTKANGTSFKRTDLLYDIINNNLYSYIEQNDLIPNLNNYIYCQFTLHINESTVTHVNTKEYYFGVYLNLTYKNNQNYVYNAFQAQTITLTLGEIDNNTAKLEVYCTIPILCRSSIASCSLPVSLAIQGDYGSDLVRTLNCNTLNCDGCMKNLKNQINPDSTNIASWDIITTVEALNAQNPSSATIQLQVIKSINVAGDYWNNIKIPKVKVEYMPRNQQVTFARSYNDPHMLSFDQTPFEFQNHGGEYLMMENKKTLLRVHAIASSCRDWIFCNDRLYVQSVDDVVIHDIATPDVLYYIDLNTQPINKIQIAFDANNNGILFKKFGVQITRSYGYFQIITHFSTLIRVYWYGGNFEIYPSKMDLYNVWGLLGNYDKNPRNDLTELENKVVTDRESFFQAYNVAATGRPLMSNNLFYEINNVQMSTTNNLTQYCVCTNQTGQYNVLCPIGLTQLGTKILTRSPRNKITLTEAQRITKLIENFGGEKDFRKKRYFLQRLKRSTTDLCVQVLDIEAFRNCSNQKLINLTSIIELCHFDFNQTGEDWSDQYYQNVLESCKTLLLGDKNNYIATANNQSVPQLSLLDNLCLNNCTGHGKCLNGTCYCDEPFAGDDCSVDRSIPPSILNSSFTNNLCDSTSNKCFDLLLLLNRTSLLLTLKYDTFKQRNGEMKNVDNGTSDVLFMSSNLIYAIINNYTQNEEGLSVVYYTITVSDCNCSRSEPFYYTIYKSACHECIDVHDCTVKSGTCDINDNCYRNGDQNPLNENEICNHTSSKFTWSQKSLVSSSTVKAQGLAPGIIAAIVVSSIIGVILIVTVTVGVIVAIVFKRRMK